jgi:hypothetical protein
MNLRNRIERLEGGQCPVEEPVSILIIAPFVRPGDPEPDSAPAFAYFMGFGREQLVAEQGEAMEAFEARCKAHLASPEGRTTKEAPECP